ncbi:MAG: bioC 3, partial [Rhodospirillales bacterium]|nr:bioC 3 [Rhodospirillales bacterium]
MSDVITVFDRAVLRRRRERAAAVGGAEFLFVEAAELLAERLEDVNRVFPRALDLGCRDGLMARALGTRGGVVDLVQADPAPGFTARAEGLRLAAEPEALPFAPASFDAVLSALALHWVNDLPGALLQLRQALKPDGLLLASLLGGETLTELRQVLIDAEIAEEGGLSPRVS